MSIRYQLFTGVLAFAIVIATVRQQASTTKTTKTTTKDDDEDENDDTCRRYVKPERLLSPRQFYVSNLTCQARRNLPLAKLFGRNYNATSGGRTGRFKENRQKRMTDRAGQTNPFSLRARSCLLRMNGNRKVCEVALSGKLAIFCDLT